MNATPLSDPLFRTGYADAWDGRESGVQGAWDEAERAAYVSGFDFALWLQNAGEDRIRLLRHGLPNPEAQALLARARRYCLLGVRA